MYGINNEKILQTHIFVSWLSYHDIKNVFTSCVCVCVCVDVYSVFDQTAYSFTTTYCDHILSTYT